MSIVRRYHPSLDFVLTRISGDLDDEQLERHVRVFNSEAADRQGLMELADCRELRNVDRLNVTGALNAAALEQGQPRVAGGRLAILVPDNPVIFGLARAYASIACLHRDTADVCQGLREALECLGFKGADMDEVFRFIDQGDSVATV